MFISPPTTPPPALTIGIEDDDIPEDDETILVELELPQGGAVVGPASSVTVLIAANDYVGGLLSFTQTTHLVKEGEDMTGTVIYVTMHHHYHHRRRFEALFPDNAGLAFIPPMALVRLTRSCASRGSIPSRLRSADTELCMVFFLASLWELSPRPPASPSWDHPFALHAQTTPACFS